MLPPNARLYRDVRSPQNPGNKIRLVIYNEEMVLTLVESSVVRALNLPTQASDWTTLEFTQRESKVYD